MVCDHDAELDPVAVGHAQHLADHREGQREGQLADEVDRLVAGGEVVEDLVDERAGAIRGCCSTARGVNALDTRRRMRVWSGGSMFKMARLRSIGDPPFAARSSFICSLPLGPSMVDVALLDAGAGLAEHGVDVGPAGDQPRSDRALVDGVVARMAAYCAYGSS